MTNRAAAIDDQEPVEVDVPVEPRAALWEQAALALWILVTFVTFPGDELLLYPLALFWAGCIALRRTKVVPLALRSWIIFTIPALATLSAWWAPAFTPAFRFGLMMLLTAAIAVYLASHFSPKQLIQSLFAAGLVAVLMVFPEMETFAWGGPYGEKNIFANRMLFVLLAAMAIAYNAQEGPILRLIAAPVVPVTFWFIVLSNSATNLVFAVVSVFTMTMVWLFWSGLGRIRHVRTLILLGIATSALLFAAVLASQPENTLFEDFLATLGKDTTLTGRTMLWDAAQRIVDEKPLFGVGAEGFWIYNRGDAQTLLELMYKDPGTRFSFHSAYYEAQIHLGLVGLVLLIATLAWSMGRSAIAWFARQDITRSFFLLITAIVFVSTFTESWFFSVLDIGATMFYVSAISSIAAVRRMQLAMVDADDLPPDMRASVAGAT